MKRRTCLALLGCAMLLGTACDDHGAGLSMSDVDPSGQWTVVQTVEFDDCTVVSSPEGSEAAAGSIPDGVGEMDESPATRVFDATIRVDTAGRFELVRAYWQVIGDDPSLMEAGGCRVEIAGVLDGDQVRVSERQANSKPAGNGLCDVEWVRATQLTFHETTFTGITESVITSCGRSCTRRVAWLASRCSACPEIDGECSAPVAGGVVSGGSRAVYRR